MMYIYNTSNYPLSDDSVKAKGKAEGLDGGTLTLQQPLVFLPHQWVTTSNVNMSDFEASLYNGKIKSLVEKGYLRVLTAEEYRQEIQKSKREKDLAIPAETPIPQGLGIYGKAIKNNIESSKFSSLIEEDDTLVVEEVEEKEEIINTKPASVDDDRFDRLEKAIYNLANIVSTALVTKDTKKVSRKKVTKKPVKKVVKKKSKK